MFANIAKDDILKELLNNREDVSPEIKLVRRMTEFWRYIKSVE